MTGEPMPEEPTPEEPTSTRRPSGLRALLRPRLRRVDLAVAVLLALLGFAAVVQLRSTRDDVVLASARQEDLVRILDDLSNRDDRLRREVLALTASRERLATGRGSAQEALQEARRRAQVLGVLAGTVPAEGPGIVLTVTDPTGEVGADDLLDALEELRDAGAEAVQVSGGSTGGGRAGTGPVRVVASTWFLPQEGGVEVDGTLLRPPYRFAVVGDAATMAAALAIPGGVVDNVEQQGGRARVVQLERVAVSALRPLERPRYARPAPAAGGG
ncbi:MAG: DUF881 domain-containing protein [Actinomycetota bacterium]|nr:DUF881 domain-containing protein [Actinomycetota bacterium]